MSLSIIPSPASSVSRRLAYALLVMAFAVILSKAFEIPWDWVSRPFGYVDGGLLELMRMVLFTMVIINISAILLAAGCALLNQWAVWVAPWLAIALVHVIQDAVLAWAVLVN